jgi:predicted nucleic acid-binding protein
MGIIVDTSTLVTAERRKHSSAEIFAQLQTIFGDTEVALSAITVAELAHGIERAEPEVRRRRRQAFLDDLLADLRIYPVTTEVALRAGRISGQLGRQGIVVPFEDLLIGATALHNNFEIVTENVSHFGKIPGLTVKAL